MYGYYRLCNDYNVRTVGTGRICPGTGSVRTNVRTVGTGRTCTSTGSVKTIMFIL